MAKKKKYNKIAVTGNVGRQPDRTGTKTIILTQTRRGNIDIGDYMTALKAAENVDFPCWSKLYDIYEDILTDGHLSAVIQKRKSPILNTPDRVQAYWQGRRRNRRTTPFALVP